MLKNIIRGEWKTDVSYSPMYMYDRDSGFWFPCDEAGNLLHLPPEAEKNYEYCRNHPEEFEIAGEVRTIRNEYREPDTGVCSCGQKVDLIEEYYGACQCPKCGKWYNLFGQELLPPEAWEEDPAEEEYW